MHPYYIVLTARTAYWSNGFASTSCACSNSGSHVATTPRSGQFAQFPLLGSTLYSRITTCMVRTQFCLRDLSTRMAVHRPAMRSRYGLSPNFWIHKKGLLAHSIHSASTIDRITAY